MPIMVSLLIGQYAQDYYLNDGLKLTDRVKLWQDYSPNYFLLPHPSPRNNIWLKRNPWFEQDVIPHMRMQLQKHLNCS
jgi:uracil-DNA glycosylase